MRKIRIISILSASVISTSLILGGCSNEVSDFNQAIVISEDVKTDTEPSLKIISKETIYLDEVLEQYGYSIGRDDEDNLMVQYYEAGENSDATYKYKLNIEGNKATKKFVEVQYSGGATCC